MLSKIKNEHLTVEIKSLGAELSSIKLNSDDTEYLWQANSDFWGRSAPVLFPIVGKADDNHYRYNNNEYTLTQHGFARDTEFEVADSAQDKVTYVLSSNAETLKKYPFDFQLKIGYALEDNKIKIDYTVENKGDSLMYFSIGAHPGFNCPLLGSEKMEDYYLEFECNENASRAFLENGLKSGKTEIFLENEKTVKLSGEFFRKDAIILKDLKSTWLAMKSSTSGKAVTVEFEGFPYMGIWSKPSGAPFVCIEPWFGITDTVGFDGDFTQKEGILCLKPAEDFHCRYSFIIE